MRFAVILLAVVASAAAAFGVYRYLGGTDSCQVFGADVDLAVTKPTTPPDPDDHRPLEYGSCSTISTKKFDVHAFGWNRHSEHTVAGRIYASGGDRRQLRATKVALKEDGSFLITLLPKLGPGAFLATRTKPDASPDQSFGGLPDPANALPLPATAYWASARFGSVSVSATGDGATVEQSQRATERLAELVSRRPLEMAR